MAFNKYSNLHEAAKRPQSMKISTDIYATLRILLVVQSQCFSNVHGSATQTNAHLYFMCCVDNVKSSTKKDTHTVRENVEKKVHGKRTMDAE